MTTRPHRSFPPLFKHSALFRRTHLQFCPSSWDHRYAGNAANTTASPDLDLLPSSACPWLHPLGFLQATWRFSKQPTLQSGHSAARFLLCPVSLVSSSLGHSRHISLPGPLTLRPCRECLRAQLSPSLTTSCPAVTHLCPCRPPGRPSRRCLCPAPGQVRSAW